MEPDDKIFIAGHTGLIGSAFQRRLTRDGFRNLLVPDHRELELTNESDVSTFFELQKPDYVILAAGRVGGIVENKTYPADFINTNLAIQLNVMKNAWEQGTKKLVFFASSCMYPRITDQPMPESALLSGSLEPTSIAYAVSKLAGMEMCLAYNRQHGGQRFIPVIPNSTYGPNDNFNPESGHVLSALIRRFHEAKVTGAPEIILWGSGAPRREFIHVDDVADACLFLLDLDKPLDLPINIGIGRDYSIRELAEKIAGLVGFDGKISWDTSKPNGAPQKLLDSERLNNLGWQPAIDFQQGLKTTYDWYLSSCHADA